MNYIFITLWLYVILLHFYIHRLISERKMTVYCYDTQGFASWPASQNAWFHNFSSPPTFAEIHFSCDKIYHKQEVCFPLYILGKIVT